jgi:hypothetical protein
VDIMKLVPRAVKYVLLFSFCTSGIYGRGCYFGWGCRLMRPSLFEFIKSKEDFDTRMY